MGKRMICPNCGFQGKPKRSTRGSLMIEIVLWLAFIFPGLLYSLWRLSTRSSVCPQCGAGNLVPPDSPRGRKLTEELR